MAKLRVHNMAMSVDGYVAGVNQTLEEPLGAGGERLHGWMFTTRTWLQMIGGGIEVALERAFEAAAGADVRLGGGASAVRQYLRAGLIDDLHVAIVPILLGAGERLFDDVAGVPDGYECA